MKIEKEHEKRYIFANVAKLQWWKEAPKELFMEFLHRIRPGLSKVHFNQWASHRRGISAKAAGDIERASMEMHEFNEDIPIILRGELCGACSKCGYFLAQQDRIDADE